MSAPSAAKSGHIVTSGIARGAALIAGLTILSRLLGLVRTLVFSQSVGAGCLGTAYITAYQVPNLIYELVLGGALTSAMVPVLARSAGRAGEDPQERQQVSQITSALLTWSVILLVPLTIAVAAAAGPIARLLNPANPNAHCDHAQMVSATSGILAVFAPQVILYGLSVVLFGLLQAYRRFTAPALAPMVASLVLIASYLVFVPLDGGVPLGQTPATAELVLSAGATLGIAVLVLVAIPPVWRLKLRLRPTLRLPSGVGRRAGGLALVGIAELVVIDISSVVTIALANGRGDTGALVIFNYAWLVFNAVYAVLALSIVTSAFPVLSANDGDAFDRTCAGSTRAVVLASWLGTAVLAAIAVPAAHVLAKRPDQVPELVAGFLLFAPGVAGIAVVANLSRAMFALGLLRVAAAALIGSWLLVIVADVVLAELAPPRMVVGALALGTTIGQTVVAIPLAIATRQIRGPAAVHGIGHATLAGLAAAVASAAAGFGISAVLPQAGRTADAMVAVVAASLAVLVFAAVAFLLDRGDLRAFAGRALRFAGAARSISRTRASLGDMRATAQRGIEDLYKEHALGLFRFALLLTGDKSTAEDLVQDAFLGLYRHWATMQDQARVLGYLRTAVVNGSRSLHRRRLVALRFRADPDPPVWSAEAAMLAGEDRREVLAAVSRLPRRQREVLALKYFADLSEAEIASVLRISRGTVTSTSSRALGALARQLGERES